MFHTPSMNNENYQILEQQITSLKEKLDKVESVSQAKSNFIAQVSHEFRTPLNGIMGMARILSETSLDLEQTEYVQRLIRASEMFASLLNNILDLSQIENGQLALEPQPFNLRNLIEDTIEMMHSIAAEKQIMLLARFAKNLPLQVIGDSVKLQQIIVNLMSNALKFTDQGHVLIEVSQEKDAYVFSIQDSGIGIAQEDHHRVFDKFTQIKKSSRTKGGKGLGLAIVKQLVTLMKGSITLESEVGKGSTFRVYIPLHTNQAMLEESVLPTELTAKKILIADGNPLRREVTLSEIEHLNFSVESAATLEETLQLLQKSSAANMPFHLCIIDQDLPPQGSSKAVKAIKMLPFLAKKPALFYVSANGQGIKEAHTQGFDGYLLRPIRQTTWLETLTAYGEDSKEIQPVRKIPTATTVKTTSFAGAKILLVDDNEINQLLAKQLLQKIGCNVEIAENGEIAIQKNESEHYDVILMDCIMPVMDGYKATEIIRLREGRLKKHTPIIAMTANVMKGDEQYCLTMGMDDYIGKPIRQEAVTTILEKWLNRA